jgi:hypothetical protein
VSNNEPNVRVQTPKLKKMLTATMKRRALKPKNIEKSIARLLSKVLLERDRI